ncbi:MAG: hypothetical protein DID91_2727704811 [Candidatus Nitrotoga sp. MKT]|nr:MAG: hypothetical protein DID91_2727704811 [Candidatus Nitrotoga sp. MKT]
MARLASKHYRIECINQTLILRMATGALQWNLHDTPDVQLVYQGMPAELAHTLSAYVTKMLSKKPFWSVRKLSAANRSHRHKIEDEGK